MRKLHMILVGFIILMVLLAGCVGRKAAEPPQQKQQGEGLEGNLTVPGENDLAIEDPLVSADENVDMGSLI